VPGEVSNMLALTDFMSREGTFAFRARICLEALHQVFFPMAVRIVHFRAFLTELNSAL
jgi:hypothetical protein